MKVFILSPKMTTTEKRVIEKCDAFLRIIMNQFISYGIEYYCINKVNYKSLINKIDKDAILIVFNGDADNNDELYKVALEKQCDIYPVAIDKQFRKPTSLISHKQSYDVYEQLRKRDLSEEYISIAANVFARIIISDCKPTIVSDEMNIFLSHRRLDGEEITASICDTLNAIAPEKNYFRDIVNVKTGENAQEIIDSALVYSDILVFFHTELSAVSDWILKELSYAIINNIPVLWVKIGDVNINELKYRPSENPHLSYLKEDFENQNKLVEIADQILSSSFEMLLEKSNDVYDEIKCASNYFNDKLELVDSTQMLYSLSLPRKGYRYPQRKIRQFIQFFGRMPKENDFQILRGQLSKFHNSEFDSAIMLSKRVSNRHNEKGLLLDNFDDFNYTYEKYLYGISNDKPFDIIISGAFPDGDEIFKQNLTYALTCFVKEILKEGFCLSFGAHPTFQELIFDTAKSITPLYCQKVSMFISNFFVSHSDIMKFSDRCTPVEIEKIENSLPKSLTMLRKRLIERDNVKALICLGGKIKTNKSEEGIREEIALAKSKGIPVFLIGSVGGCSSKIALDYSTKNKWNELNNASKSLNEKLMNSIDYKESAKLVINYIKTII